MPPLLWGLLLNTPKLRNEEDCYGKVEKLIVDYDKVKKGMLEEEENFVNAEKLGERIKTRLIIWEKMVLSPGFVR